MAINKASASKFIKRTLPLPVFRAIKRFYELSSPRRLIFLLPHKLFSRYQYPQLLTLTLTTRCNLQCFICRREEFRGEDLEFENIYKLKKAIARARWVMLRGFGEPLLYPRFDDVLDYIYSLNPRKDLIQITTNGTRLSKQIADLLRGHLHSITISLNAAAPETYNRDMKNGKFHKTLNAIQDFFSGLDKKDRGKVTLFFVAHTRNFRELPDFVMLAKELGISSVSVGQYLVGSPEHSQYSLFHVKEEYNAIVEQAQSLGKELGIVFFARRRFFNEKRLSPRQCLSPFTECLIEVKGTASPCCYCGSYRIGNVFETNFESVWFSEDYRQLRKKRHLEACRNCILFLPLDDYRTHFTPSFQEKSEFREMVHKPI